MSHKFTIEYDMSHGIFENGRCGRLGVYDTIEEAMNHFDSAMEKVHDLYCELPYEKRKRTSYLVATYAWVLSESGELTDEDAWDELTPEEQEKINSLSHAVEAD